MVYAVDADVVTVWEVWVDGVRSTGAAYAEALQRMVSADAPDAVELAGILERLGRITGTVPVPRNRVVEPVPDWLADALLERTVTHPPRSRRHGRHRRLRRLERPHALSATVRHRLREPCDRTRRRADRMPREPPIAAPAALPVRGVPPSGD